MRVPRHAVAAHLEVAAQPGRARAPAQLCQPPQNIGQLLGQEGAQPRQRGGRQRLQVRRPPGRLAAAEVVRPGAVAAGGGAHGLGDQAADKHGIQARPRLRQQRRAALPAVGGLDGGIQRLVGQGASRAPCRRRCWWRRGWLLQGAGAGCDPSCDLAAARDGDRRPCARARPAAARLTGAGARAREHQQLLRAPQHH